MTEEEYTAFLITKLLAIVNPRIDTERAFPIVYDMVIEGLTDENYDTFGTLIYETAFEPSRHSH